VPLLAGATLPDRLVACLGALAGIALTAFVSAQLPLDALPLLVAPVGASAVLLFAVPASPLAQPWPIVGGNTISAVVGVTAALVIPEPRLAAGVAVAGAILAMSLLRCLHPPGGAAALTAVIGGPAIASAGYLFPFVPVALNSLLLVGTGILFHRFSRHSYPHRTPAAAPQAFHPEDIDAALADVGETFDVSRADLDLLLRRAELHAASRRHAALRASAGRASRSARRSTAR
jgi:CBS domain-containing membrane protein